MGPSTSLPRPLVKSRICRGVGEATLLRHPARGCGPRRERSEQHAMGELHISISGASAVSGNGSGRSSLPTPYCSRDWRCPSRCPLDVRFGSKADISQCNRHVRFTPNSGHEMAMRDLRCCALAASGQAAAEPAIALMNLRRLMPAPEVQDMALYSRKLAHWTQRPWDYSEKPLGSVTS